MTYRLPHPAWIGLQLAAAALAAAPALASDPVLGPAGYCLVEPPALEQPAHLAATLDPVSGQGLVRITGEPGTAIDAPVVPVDGLDLGGQPAYEVFWTEASRQGYPLNPAWSTDQSLLKLSVFTDDEPRLRYDVFLDGSSYEPRVVTQLPPGGGFRWSEAPGASDRFYKFPWTRRQRDGQPDPTATAGDIVYEFVVDPDEPSVERVRSIHLPAQFDMHALGGKSSIAFVGGREVVALVGGVAVGMGQYDWFAYLFDLVTEEMVGAPFELTDPQCGLDDPQTCRMLYWNQLRFSPDGTHLLVAYDGGTTRPQRLLDVDPVHGVITPHALPEDDCTRCLGGDRSEGFMRASWGHPTFARGEDSDYLVGTTQWTRKTVDFVDTPVDEGGRVGRVVAFDLLTDSYRSLTDPDAEAMFSHVSAANRDLPGWIYVTYGSDPGGKFSEEVVAIHADEPWRVERIVHHRSKSQGCYLCQPQGAPSRDGGRVVFASTWGEDQDEVGAYVAQTPMDEWTDVCTADELWAMRDDLDGNYRLICDVDLEGVDWEPVGGYESGSIDFDPRWGAWPSNEAPMVPFTGSFDGNGKTLRNLRVETAFAAGFFGLLEGALVRDLRIEDAEIHGRDYVGILGGSGVGTTITDVSVSGTVEVDPQEFPVEYGQFEYRRVYGIGGLIGQLSGELSRSHADVDILVDVSSDPQRPAQSVGGLVGRASPIRMTHCVSEGTLTLLGRGKGVGGLGGILYGSVERSLSSVAVTSTDGRIVGGLAGMGGGYFRESSFSGSIDVPFIGSTGGLSIIGGLVGNWSGGNADGSGDLPGVYDCSFTGTITTPEPPSSWTWNDFHFYRSAALVGNDVGVWFHNWGHDRPIGDLTIARSYSTGSLVRGGQPLSLPLVKDPMWHGPWPTAETEGQGCEDEWDVTTLSFWESELPLLPMHRRWGHDRSRAELEDPATYAGWDFETVWEFPAGGGTPQLRRAGLDPIPEDPTYDCATNPPARIEINRRPYQDFGTHVVGKRRTTSFILSNQQDGVATEVFVEPLEHPFTVITRADSCPIDPVTGTFELQPQERCRVHVAYRATEEGQFEDSLRVHYTSAGFMERSIERRMVAEAYSGAYLVLSNGHPASWRNRTVGSQTNAMYTVTNLGDQPALDLAATLSTTLGSGEAFAFRGGSYPGTGAASSYGVGACGGSLPGLPDDPSTKVHKCRVAVVFQPGDSGAHEGAIELSYSDSSATRSARRSLSGSGQ